MNGCWWRTANILFQFTPLREGRPMGDTVLKNLIDISIHAPPRGATRFFLVLFLGGEISIHAPPRGATVGSLSVV